MAVPAGGAGTRAGSSGWTSTSRALWPADGGKAPAGMLTWTWSSGVDTRAAAEPVPVRGTVADTEAGALFPARRSEGGRTHRYAGGGASPSKTGIPTRSPSATDPHAATTSRTPAANPHTRDRCRVAIRCPLPSRAPAHRTAGPPPPPQHHDEDDRDHDKRSRHLEDEDHRRCLLRRAPDGRPRSDEDAEAARGDEELVLAGRRRGQGVPARAVPVEDVVRSGGERQDDRDRHRGEGLSRGFVDGVVLVGVRVVVVAARRRRP